MPLLSIDLRSRLLKHRFERSPRISVITDATDIHSISQEMSAIVGKEPRVVRGFSDWAESKGASDAALVWHAGERLVEGSAGHLLKPLHVPDSRSFVLVNTPCVDEIPFLTIQPRVLVGRAEVDRWHFEIRIESTSPATAAMVDSSRPAEPWAKLVDAIAAEKTTAGSRVEPLLRLWESREKVPEIIGALVLRNLVAVMLLHREVANARKFLEAGAKLYPTYAEVHYLAALLAMRERRHADALPLLERAKSCGVVIPGSGGENSYRNDWLLGMLAAQVGNDRVAFEHFLSGVRSNLLFEPSLTEILKLRVPHSMVERHQYVFTQAARRKPYATARIFEYLLRHRVFEAARRIVQTVVLEPSQRESLENQLASSEAPFRATSCLTEQNPTHGLKRTGIVFEGPFFEYSSLARVNREIACGLMALDGFDVRVEPSASAATLPCLIPGGTTLSQAVHKPIHQLDLTIRHQWPPDLRRPSTGKLAVIVPWEYGGVPDTWVSQINQNVDELWVPSNFVREVFVWNGVEGDRVKVVPNGCDPKVFNPEGPRLRPHGSRDFVFLFVGGAIRRKGVDLLLDAYASAFSSGENVTLVLLVSGSTGAYQHNSLVADVRAAAPDSTRAHVLPIFETIDDSTLANLYRGADAFVLPYRGEGFGMPLLEAMACGKPVITTAEGPARDFCDPSNGYLVAAQSELVPDKPPPLGPMVGSFTWFEPNFGELCRTLRHVYENRQEAAAKGQAAANSVRHLTWQNATKQYEARIRSLMA